MAMLKSFLFHWRPAKTMAQNTDSRFGLTAAPLSVSEHIIFKTFTKLAGISRAHRVKDVVVFHVVLIGFAVKAPVTGQ